MQSTSPTFEPFPDARSVDFRVRFELLDTNAKSAATPSASGSEAVSQLSQLTDDTAAMGGKYATLEDDLWVLDGSFDILPDSVSGIQTGWWSNVLSGADKAFASPPWLKFSFGATAVSVIGFTLNFDDQTGQYPTSIRATTYAANGTTVISTGTFTNNSTTAVLWLSSANIHSVKFEFLETSEAYRRVKVSESVFGIVQIFDEDSLVGADLKYGADVTGATFPSRELTFAFDNSDHKYNLINPNGLYAFLQNGQKINAKCYIGGEAVDMGDFYFTASEADDDEITAKITANDIALALDGAVYNGGSNITSTLSTALTAVLGGGISVSTTSGSTTVSMAIPQGTTKREAVRLLAQAACCSAWFDRAGVLQVYPIGVDSVADDVLDAANSYSLGGISIDPPVDSVVLTVENEFASTKNTYTAGSGTNVKQVSNPCVANGATVAAWLLTQYQRRTKYNRKNRCNPAVEIGDTLTIYDSYGENNKAAVTEIDIAYDGGLSAATKAVGA